MTRLIRIVGALALVAGIASAGTLLFDAAGGGMALEQPAGDAPAADAGSAGSQPDPDPEADTGARAPDASTGPQPATAGEDPEASADDQGPGDVFVPTEDISEDFAVSFPVDI